MNSAVASHYARALADAVFAPESGLSAADAGAQLKSMDELISGSKELQTVLLSPAVLKTRKEAVLTKLADEVGVHRLIRNFLLVVVAHRRIQEMSAMRKEFDLVADERLGWVPAEISSAKELAPEQKEEIERALGSKLGKYIRAHYHVDPDLLAGVRAQVASREYDATLRGKLDSLRQRLAASH